MEQEAASSVGGANGGCDGVVEEEGTETWSHFTESLPIIGTSIPANIDLFAIFALIFVSLAYKTLVFERQTNRMGERSTVLLFLGPERRGNIFLRTRGSTA